MKKSKEAKSQKKSMTTVESKKEKDKSIDNQNNNSTTPTIKAEDSKVLEDTIELHKKNEELNDKYLRLYSEFDNYRKRSAKERIDQAKFASEEFIKKLLPIIDDFERAIDSFDNIEIAEPIKEGTKLIYNKFKNILTNSGLSETKALGEHFNTDYHEAVATVSSENGDEKNLIIDVTEKGYTLHDKVIRFSKVVVKN